MGHVVVVQYECAGDRSTRRAELDDFAGTHARMEDQPSIKFPTMIPCPKSPSRASGSVKAPQPPEFITKEKWEYLMNQAEQRAEEFDKADPLRKRDAPKTQ